MCPVLSVQEFGSFERTLQTEFQMLFGEFVSNWANDPQLPRELQVSLDLVFTSSVVYSPATIRLMDGWSRLVVSAS